MPVSLDCPFLFALSVSLTFISDLCVNLLKEKFGYISIMIMNKFGKILNTESTYLKKLTKTRLKHISWTIDLIVFNATFSNISAISWRPV